MDDTQRDSFYRRSTFVLGQLAADPVGLLRERGIKGERSNVTSPVVHLLNEDVPPPAGHRWLANRDHVRLQNTDERESVLIVFTPDAVRDFEERFDQGCYPDLLAEDDRG